MKAAVKLTSVALAAAVAAGAFFLPESHAESVFSDVPDSAWYAKDVYEVQAYGVINGVGDGRFNPDGELTLAEAITLAAKTRAYYDSEEIPNISNIWWYDDYVDYAQGKHIIDPTADYGEEAMLSPCSRMEMGFIFSNALPAHIYNNINPDAVIPDVPYPREGNGGQSVQDYIDYKIYVLYRAGILTGSDEFGTFNGSSTIKRSEAAAIINRVINKDRRVVKYGDEVKNLYYMLADYLGSTDGIYQFAPYDYDQDGSIEAFAIAEDISEIPGSDERKFYPGNITGNVYFIGSAVSGSGVERIGDAVTYCWDAENFDPVTVIYSSEQLAFFRAEEVYATDSLSHIYGVIDGKWFESEYSKKGSNFGLNRWGDIVLYASKYDCYETEPGGIITGKSVKPYYLYYKGPDLAEYQGEIINTDDESDYRVATYGNAIKEITGKIEAAGGTLVNIMYRAGIFQFNYFIASAEDPDTVEYRNYAIRCKYEDDSYDVIYVYEDYVYDNELDRANFGGLYTITGFENGAKG